MLPNLTIFVKKSSSVGLNGEGTASGCSDSHNVAEKKTGSGGNASWIGMKKSPVDFSIVTNGNGEPTTVLELFCPFFLSREKREIEKKHAKQATRSADMLYQ